MDALDDQAGRAAEGAAEGSSLWREAGGAALRSFGATVGVAVLAAAALASAAAYALRQWPMHAALVAAVVVVEVLAVGVALAGHRAVFSALIRGVRRLGLGRRAVELACDRLLGGAPRAQGEPAGGGNAGGGNALSRGLQRLPLGQLERALADGAHRVARAPDSGGGVTGWLRRGLERRLVGAVRRVTLARYRDAAAQEGGIDVARVRADLGGHVDSAIAGRLSAVVTFWSLLAAVAVPLVVAAEVWLVRTWLVPK